MIKYISFNLHLIDISNYIDDILLTIICQEIQIVKRIYLLHLLHNDSNQDPVIRVSL
jgi:hypothetical protein